MAYINKSGNLVETPPAHSRFLAFFYGIWNFIMLFVKTLVSPGYSGDGKKTDDYRDASRFNGRGGPPGPPRGGRRPMGGLARGGGAACPPMAGGG